MWDGLNATSSSTASGTGGMGKLEVERNVSVATQKQFLSALLFLCK